MSASARRRSRSPMGLDGFSIEPVRPAHPNSCRSYLPATASTSPPAAREDEQLRRHVAVERDRAQVLIGRGVVQVDGVAGVVDVEHLAVRAGLQRHARPALELGAARPACGARDRTSRTRSGRCPGTGRRPTLRPGAIAKLDRRRRARACRSRRVFAARLTRPMPMIRRCWIGSETLKMRGVEAGLVVEDVASSRTRAGRSLPRSACDSSHLSTCVKSVGVVDQHVLVAEQVHQLAVGRELDVGVLALLAVRPRDGADDLVLLQVVLHQRRRADLEAVDQLGRRRREHHHEAVQRIRLDAPDPDLLVALAQREGVDRRSRRRCR